MIFNFPAQEKLAQYNVTQVFLKKAPDKPVRLIGKVLQATDDSAEVLIETEYEYASFLCEEVAGVRFGRQE